MFARFEVYGEWLKADPAGFAVYLVYFAVAVLLSLILHECAHGYVALQCGDPTAKMMGRLTLDPRRHLDPIGTVCMVVLGFGWARPVPVNPRNYRNIRRDDFLVSIAGITVNLTMFIVCTGLSVLVNRLMVGEDIYAAYNTGVLERAELYHLMRNIILFGGASLPAELSTMLASPWLQYVQRFLLMMAMMNLPLAVFNLLPFPPLDGFRLLNNALKGRLRMTAQTFQILRAGLLILCLTGLLGRVLGTVTDVLDSAVLNVFMRL